MSKKKRPNRATLDYQDALTNMQPTSAQVDESYYFMFYFRKFMELSMSRFKWNGLPKSVDTRYLEMTLLRNGLSVFYFDTNYDRFLSLSGTPHGHGDMNGNPTWLKVISENGRINKTLKIQQCIPIWANSMRVSEIPVISYYAKRIAKIDQTIDINMDNARMPRIIEAGREHELTMENFNRQVDQGVPVIRVRPSANPMKNDSVKVLDMGVNPDTFEKISVTRSRIMNEFYGQLGIAHTNTEKKERMNTDEVSANSEQVHLMKMVALESRRIAADQINRKFRALDVTVDYNTNIDQMVESFEDDIQGIAELTRGDEQWQHTQ